MKTPDFKAIIKHELEFFPSAEMRQALLSLRNSPRSIVQNWDYGKESHICWIIASDSKHQIVYCRTGFGPDFPWSCQPLGEKNLGMDSQWCAYLYEAFVQSGMWNGEIPIDFTLKGTGERINPTDKG